MTEEVMVAKKDTKKIKLIILAVFVIIFGSFIYFLANNLDTPTSYKGGRIGGKSVPDLTLKTMDGKTINLTSLQGKTVFINFFNTWCVPCQEEEPVLDQFIRENSSNPDFVFISIARQDSKENIQNWIDEKKPSQYVVFDDGDISLAFGVTGQPETYAINKNGIVSATLLSRASSKSLDQMLLSAE